MAKIEIYTKNVCAFCYRAKHFFKSKKFTYVEYNIDENPNYLKIMLNKSNGQKKFPQIFVNDFHIGGFDRLIDLQNNGQLDKILKP